MTSAVDDLLLGCVLLDHLYDWGQDLGAGRYNAFVAYCSNLPQVDDKRKAIRETVLKKLYLSNVVPPYLDLIHEYLARAKARAASVECEGLVEFIDVLARPRGFELRHPANE